MIGQRARFFGLAFAATPATATAHAGDLVVDKFFDEFDEPSVVSDNDEPFAAKPSVWRVTPVLLDSLPHESIPTALDKATRPTRVPEGSSSPDIRIVKVKPKKFNEPSTSAVDVRIEAVQPGGGGYFVGVGATHVWQSSWNAACRKGGALVGLRWETLRFDGGRAILEMQDGLFDQDTCAIAIQRKTTLHPKVLLSHGPVPVLFGIRSDEGLTLMLPPTITAVEADALGQSVPAFGQSVGLVLSGVLADRGSLQSITLPIARGGAATALASLFPAVVAKWIAIKGGPGVADPKEPANLVLTVAVDVTQPADDATPTVVVRTTTDTNDHRFGSKLRPFPHRHPRR